ncbi:MAG: hypothetical protein R2772_01555 [Chitinophagales bacterium]
MISKVKALGKTKNNPILAIIIPKKIGLREKEKKPWVINLFYFLHLCQYAARISHIAPSKPHE